MMPTLCRCGHESAAHGAVSRLCLAACACIGFSLPGTVVVDRWRPAANWDLHRPSFTAARKRLLRRIGQAGHLVRLTSQSCEPSTAEGSHLRMFGVCGRCRLGVLVHSDPTDGARLDGLSSEALATCRGRVWYPTEPWTAAGIPL
jgi:hypothetical protein